MIGSPDPSANKAHFGGSLRRVEDPHLLRGDTTFVANVKLDGALAVHYVTSIEAHAMITAIDTAAAASAPGVVDVVTAADLDLGPTPPAWLPRRDEPPLPRHRPGSIRW
ncbi:MAG: hypothetical protein R2706_20760 [Acidimicrobiales bacterium]